MIFVLLLVSVLLAATGHAQNSSTCENSFHILEQDFLSSLENRYQISRAFYPPRGPRPVVLRIHYLFPDGTNLTWYWSRAHFYLIQPLEIFQFTSLLFSSPPSRSGEVTLTLSQECATANQETMEVLTQRMKLYASTATISVTASPQRISDNYVALAASLDELKADVLPSTFIKIWLHMFLILFPVCSLFCLWLCDPVRLLLGEKVWNKLEDESNHPRIAALMQISVIFTTFVFVCDLLALGYTITGDFLSYNHHAAFYLTTVTGMITDTLAFMWVMFVLIKSCHWDCKNFWYRWRKRQPCNKGESEKIKKLMSTIFVAPALCLGNHIHYILLAVIADPFHATGIIITYLVTFILNYFLFEQFYNCVVFRSYHRQKDNKRKIYALRAASTSTLNRQQSLPSPNPSNVLQHYQRKVKIERVPFNTQTVVFGLLILTPFIVLYEGIIITLFASIPAIEDSPSRLYSLYQGTGIIIVSLLTYNIVLVPSGFSLGKVVENIAKQIQLPQEIKNWSLLTDEEKCANVCTSLLKEGGFQELIEMHNHYHDNSNHNKSPDTIPLQNPMPRRQNSITKDENEQSVIKFDCKDTTV